MIINALRAEISQKFDSKISTRSVPIIRASAHSIIRQIRDKKTLCVSPYESYVAFSLKKTVRQPL